MKEMLDVSSRLLLLVVVPLAALVSCGSCGKKDGSSGNPVPKYESLEVGLTDDDREAFWHTTEGSDLVPLIVVQALKDPDTGKSMVEAMLDYGFLPSETTTSNPFGLPVGWSAHVPRRNVLKVPFVGLNCAACHTGQVEYQGRRLRIDGAPNMVDLEKWVLQLVHSLEHTLSDPVEGVEFFARLAKLALESAEAELTTGVFDFLNEFASSEAKTMANTRSKTRSMSRGKPVAAARGHAESLLAQLENRNNDSLALDSVGFLRPYLEATFSQLESVLIVLNELGKPPAAGPGRDDPWGIIRNVVYKNPTPLTAPTSIPHLFYSRDIDWFHADGNTTSLLERNVAQGIALGASVDETTNVSSLVAKNLNQLQAITEKLTKPAWPAEVFGAIDSEKAARGKALFENRQVEEADGNRYTCRDCHASRKSKFFDLSLIGTDPARARNFQMPLNGQPLFEVIKQTIPQITTATFNDQGVPLDPNRPNEWQETGQYVARQLDGIWATAPYLHNGSVPTLYHLLLPVDERPKTFHLGHREYDPKHVGYTTQSDDPVFTFDTAGQGNSNRGHVFGAGLTDKERWELVEYLKTL